MNQEFRPNNLSAIVLAAGQSRRTFPKNKLLLSFQKNTIINGVLDKIVPLNFAEILVITGFEENKIRERLSDYPVQFIYNPDHEQGMSTSIKAGVLKVKSDVDGIIIFLGDMPWIDRKVVCTQIQSFYINPESDIVVPVFQKRRGNPVIFAQRYKKELSGLNGDSGARSIINKYEDRVIEVRVQKERLLSDIDTWEDYENRERY